MLTFRPCDTVSVSLVKQLLHLRICCCTAASYSPLLRHRGCLNTAQQALWKEICAILLVSALKRTWNACMIDLCRLRQARLPASDIHLLTPLRQHNCGSSLLERSFPSCLRLCLQILTWFSIALLFLRKENQGIEKKVT